MSSLTPLQLQQLAIGGGVSPTLVSAYGQQQGLTDADMLQNLINQKNAQKQQGIDLQNALGRHEAEVNRRQALTPELLKALNTAVPGMPAAALPVAPAPVAAAQALPSKVDYSIPTEQRMPQEIAISQAVSGGNYADGIGNAASRFAAESNAYAKSMRKLAEDDAKLADDSAMVKARAAQELSGIQAKRSESAYKAAEQISAAQAASADIEKSASKEMADLYSQYRQSADIDPDRLMRSKGLAGSIFATLALAVGGGAASVRGGPNEAADALEKAINRDIMSQIEKRNGLRDLIAEKRAEIGDARAAALGTANMIQLKQSQEMLGAAAAYESIEKANEGTLQGNAAGLLKNDLRRRAEDGIIRVKEAVANLDTKAEAMRADAAAQSQSLMLKRGENQILPNQLVPIGPVSPDMAKAAREHMGDYNEIMSHLSTLEKLRIEAGKSGKWTGQEKYEALQTAKALFNTKRKFTGSGAALSPMETKLIEMKDPNKVSIGLIDDVLAEIRAEKGVVRRSFENQLQGNNVALRESVQEQQDIQGLRPH